MKVDRRKLTQRKGGWEKGGKSRQRREERKLLRWIVTDQ